MGIFRDRNVMLYLLGNFVSVIGSGAARISVLWVSLQLSGSATTVGTMAGVNIFIYALVGILAGVVVDRVSKRRLLMGLDFVQGVVVILVPYIAARFGILSMAHIWLYLIVISVLEVPFNQASFAIKPALVKETDDLLQINSLYTTIFNVGIVLGPALGGLILSRYGPETTFLLNGLSFFVSSFCVLLIRPYESAASRISPATKLADIRSDIAFSFRMIRDDPFVRRFTGFNIASNLVTGPLFILAPLLAEQIDIGAIGYGFLQSLMTAGTILGGLLVVVFKLDFDKVKALVFGGVFFSASFLLILLSHVVPIAFAFFLAGLFLVSGRIYGLTLIQENVEKRHLGKFVGAFGALGQVLQPITLWLSAYLIELGRLPEVIVAAFILKVIISVAVYPGLVSHRKRAELTVDS